MNAAQPDQTLLQAMTRLDALLQRVAQIGDPAVRDNVTEILHGLLDLHSQALARLLDLLAQRGPQARPILDALAADQLISSVLLVHDLHPHSITQRVQQALQQLQPRLAEHHARADLLEVTPERVVRLRLDRQCAGCPDGQTTLDSLVQEALFLAAPDIAGIDVVGAADTTTTRDAASPAPAPSAADSPRAGGSAAPPLRERRS